ncbi:MAG: HAD hydrolase family protein [Oscillospiraceae bacterium]
MDVTEYGVSRVPRCAAARLGVSPEETMAFGDFYNDIRARARRYSFVMENANRRWAHARFVAADNNRHGVTRAIREYVLEGALPD